jgi:hypothetical protein
MTSAGNKNPRALHRRDVTVPLKHSVLVFERLGPLDMDANPSFPRLPPQSLLTLQPGNLLISLRLTLSLGSSDSML